MKVANDFTHLEKMGFKEKVDRAELIIKEVDRYFNLKSKENNRKGDVVLARQMSIYYIWHYLKMSSPQISKLFPSKTSKTKHKTHATILHAYKKIDNLKDIDLEIKDFHNDLKKECRALSMLNKYEYEKSIKIKDISDILKLLNLDNLKEVEKHLIKKYENTTK